MSSNVRQAGNYYRNNEKLLVKVEWTTSRWDSDTIASDNLLTVTDISRIRKILGKADTAKDSLSEWIPDDGVEDICQKITDRMIIYRIRFWWWGWKKIE